MRAKTQTTKHKAAARHGARWLLTFALGVSPLARAANSFPLSYSGRLADASGAPLSGTVAIDAKFWSAETGGSQLGETFTFPSVELSQGVFTLNLQLTATQVAAIFGDGSEGVYVEITSANKTYPRQRFSFVPLALRVPVDNKTVTFDGSGALSLAVTGAPAANQFLTKDGTGKLVWQTPAVTGSTGEPPITSGTTSQYWRGDKTWQALTTATVAESGTALYYSDVRARASLSGTAPIAYSVTTGAISMAQASGTASGYLSSSDWSTFNAKQSALGFSPLNKAGDTMSGALDMASQKVKNLAAPVDGSDAVNKTYADAKLGGRNLEVGTPSNGQVVKWDQTNQKFYLDADQIGVSGGGIASLNSLTGASQSITTSTSGVVLGVNSTGSTHTINIPMASVSGVASGLVSNADYQSFAGKVSNVTQGTGIAVSTGSGTATVSLATTGIVGTYAKITTDAYGRVSAGSTLTASDIPPLSASSISSGALSVANGGTGATSLAANSVLLGNGTSALQTVAPGANGNVLTSTGTGWQSTTLPSSVTSVTGTAPISVATGTSTPVVSISQANTTTNGYLSATDWNTFNGKQAAGNYITTLTGDITTSGFTNGSATATLANVATAGTSTKVTYDAKGRVTSGTTLSASDIPPLAASAINSGALAVANGGTGLTAAPSNGQIPIGNGTGYTLGTLTAGTGIGITNAAGTITVSTTTDASGKVSKSGDAMTGALTLPANGLVAGTNQLVLAGGNVGIGTTVPSAKEQVVGTSADPSLTADSSIFKVTGSVAFAPEITIGSAPTWPWAMWLQTKRSNNDGTLWPLALNPLGGAVGIGTTAPIGSLDVSGALYTSAGVLNLRSQDSDSEGGELALLPGGAKSTTWRIDNYDNNLRFFNGGLVAATIVPGGNVGIGTTNPAKLLSLESSSTSDTSIRLKNISAGGGDWMLGSYGSANGGGAGRFAIWDAAVSANRFVIDGAGNVGIGTTSPAGSFHVAPTTGQSAWNYFQVNASGTTPNTSIWGLAVSGNRSASLSEINLINNTANGDGFYLDQSNGSGTYTRLMTIKGAGNVGIGTTNPSEKLEVSGNLKVSGTIFGGNLQRGNITPAAWSYSSTTSGSWVDVWSSTISVPKNSIATITLSGHFNTNGACAVTIAFDGSRDLTTVEGVPWAGAVYSTQANVWLPLSDTRFFTATAGSHTVAASVLLWTGTICYLNGARISYMITPL